MLQDLTTTATLTANYNAVNNHETSIPAGDYRTWKSTATSGTHGGGWRLQPEQELKGLDTMLCFFSDDHEVLCTDRTTNVDTRRTPTTAMSAE